jgi:hypothetical protein
MNYPRIALAGLAAWIVYFAVGGLVSGKLIADFYRPYTGVYRTPGEMMSLFPIGIVGMLVAMLVLALMYAKGYEGGSGLMEGLRFGLLVGLFVVGAVVGDEYVTLNIGGKLALVMAAGRLFGWLIVGMTLGLVYKPAKTAAHRTP